MRLSSRWLLGLALLSAFSLGCTGVVEKGPVGAEKMPQSSPEEIQKAMQDSMKYLPKNRDGEQVDASSSFDAKAAAGGTKDAPKEEGK